MKSILVVCSLLFLMSCGGSKEPSELLLDDIYKEYKVDGCFLLKSLTSGQTFVYNKERSRQGFLPASTFKIVNSIIAFETGVAMDENLLIKWDSVVRQVPTWNQDHTLKTAFQASCVPYYQKLAARIGTSRMQEWVNKLQYGKMDIRDETITDFWLKGNSKITPFEQLDFLERLVDNKLPIKPSTNHQIRSVMMIATDSLGTMMSGKTGWAVVGEKNIGWFVGIIERKDGERFVFVNNVEAKVGTIEDDAFMMCRKSIVGKVLHDLGVI